MGQIDKLEYLRRMAVVERKDLDESYTDKYGVIYSKDGKRLLKGCDLKEYIVKEGTEVICNDAFDDCYPVEYVPQFAQIYWRQSVSEYISRRDLFP